MQITQLNSALGAQISNVDLSKPLDKATETGIKKAFDEHIVLLFRDQYLEAAEQMRFTELFGKVEPHPLNTRQTVEGFPGVLILEHKPGHPGARNDYWHSDISHAEKPPLGSVLHARVVPDGKGDTMFCNMVKAWDSMSDGMREMFDGMRAWHSGAATQRRNNLENNDGFEIKSVPDPCLQPVARTHPSTQRKALYVNPHFTTHFEDMTEEESKPLLDYLTEHATRPENIYRHVRAGDVLMWDNRAAMHYAVLDYGAEDTRLMYRTTAAGDVPY